MYKIKLTKEQKKIIYSITDNKEKQSKIMSILQYCIKYSDSYTGILTKTISKLFSMYSVNNFKYHDKISRKYFYTLVNLLIDKNLVCVHKKVHKKVHKNNNNETIENTTIEPVYKKTNNLTISNTYTYTLYTTNVVHALDLVDDVFKTFKVKSKEIKSMVIAKLKNTVLDAAGAINYIVKVLTEKTEQYNLMRVKYAQKVAKTKYSKSKNTFISQSNVNTRGFNNFKSREYDYDILEDKLIYGGYNGEELPI